MQTSAQNDTSFFAPVCQVCQARNESLRLVTYPFVFSVIFATFQRVFSGVFCAKHQRRYHILASLITSTAGWLGIPYGFFLTPLTLFKLARGGIVQAEESLRILQLVADHKLRAGDIKGGIRCLEECLKFQNNAEIRQQLTRLYTQIRHANDADISDSLWQFLSVPVLLTTSLLTGLLIGLLDLLIIYILAPLFGDSGSIFVAILSWLPTVTLLFLEVLLIRFMLRWTLNKSQISSPLLGTILAFAAIFFASYSILEGHSILRNLQGLFTFFSISMTDGFFALRSVLTHGGIDVLINNFRQGDLPNLIFVVLFACGTLLTLYTGMETAIQTTHWQRGLSQLRDPLASETSRTFSLTWIMLSLFLLGIFFLNVLLYPGSFVNTEETHLEISLGMSELDQSHYEEAISHFENAAALWPNSVAVHTYLGMGYLGQDQYDRGMEEVEKGLQLDPNSTINHLMKAYGLTAQAKFFESVDQYKRVIETYPTWGLPHAALANSYFVLEQTELANQEIQLALTYESEDGQTSSAIAAYYMQIMDFQKAEEHILKAIKNVNNPADYVTLARIYILQEKFDQAAKTLEEAGRQGADPLDIYLVKIIASYAQNDLDTSSMVLSEAIKLYPDNSDLLSESSYIHFQKGHIEQSATDAERAVEINPYNATGHIEKAFAYHAQNKLNEALAAAKQGVALYPKYDRAHYILGLCYMELGMKEEAATEFERFLKLYWERPLVKEYKENAEKYLEQLR